MNRPAMGGVGGGVETVLHTSVATFYSNLVTRPTGQAVRVAIEEQLREMKGPSLSILDFSRIRVIDYSCADEVIAKLLRRYRSRERPSNAFFVVKGVSIHHRETVEQVLRRDNLLLVALEADRPALWGAAPNRLRAAWDCLGRLGLAAPAEFASARGVSLPTANSVLKRLVAHRVAVVEGMESFASLPAVADRGSGYRTEIDVEPLRRAAEAAAPYLGRARSGADDSYAGLNRGIATQLPSRGDVDELPAR